MESISAADSKPTISETGQQQQSNSLGRFAFNVERFRTAGHPQNLDGIARLIAARIENLAHFPLRLIRVRKCVDIHLIRLLAHHQRVIVGVDELRLEPDRLLSLFLYDHRRAAVHLRARNGHGRRHAPNNKRKS